MQKIAFVCTGNTCRSPMAEAIFNANANKNKYIAESMGIYPSGKRAADNSIKAMDIKGIDIRNHRPKALNNIQDYYLVFTMTESQADMLKSIYNTNNIFSLKKYVLGISEDILDPYGQELEIYLNISQELENIILKLIDKLEENYEIGDSK